jgi:transient receptor potential cation channel subfamily A protein 1
LDVESIVPQFIRRKFVRKSITVQPNEYLQNRVKRFFQRSMFMSSSINIAKALNPELVSWITAFACTVHMMLLV